MGAGRVGLHIDVLDGMYEVLRSRVVRLIGLVLEPAMDVWTRTKYWYINILHGDHDFESFTTIQWRYETNLICFAYIGIIELGKKAG